ncbi:MAG: Ig-like domain-containing protein [Thaumarchaeota archaeon]|nr:Ig-like domain-containing protein [Nitrososphaerota archaeon]
MDSQSFKYSYIALGYLAQVTCSGDLCIEYAFVATATATGTDTLTFSTAGRGYLGGDAYDIMDINASNYVGGMGASPMNLYPELTYGLPDTMGRFVAAGVIANNALQYSQQFTLFNFIPGQPCYPCGQNGGWQASVYQTVGNNEQTYIPLYYGNALQTNDGWAMMALSFAPNVSTTSISCAPSPAMVTLASTCTATVRGDLPTGNVTWTASGTGNFSESSCTLSSGTCSVSYTPSAPPSSVKISASYGGDLYNPGSSASYSLTAVKDVTTETVQCEPSPAAAGSTATCTASVSGDSPNGTIKWTTSGVDSFSPADTCTLSSGACAVYYTPSPSAAPLTITAAYSGDGNNDPVTGTFSLGVGAATSSTSASSSTSTTTSSSATVSTSTSPTTVTQTSTATTTVTQPATTSTPTSASTSSSSSTTASSSEQSTGSATTSSSSGGGGVPVFPYQLGIATVFTVILAASYLLVRNRTKTHPGPLP